MMSKTHQIGSALRRLGWVLLIGLFGVLVAGATPSPPTSPLLMGGAAQTSFAGVSAGQSTTFAVGSLIIPMDTTYQDNGMFLAYGLLYKLLKSDIPVHWVIKQGKKKGDADFTASARDIRTNATITNHGYRGGPFVIDSSFAAKALPIIKAWQAANPNTTVHQATAAFVGRTSRYLTVAPTIAVIADGNEDIAFKYLNAAKIPDRNGQAWPTQQANNYPNYPDVLTTAQIAGPTSTNHADGALFRKSGQPAYCQVMTMHWDVKKVDPEVVAEYRSFLKFPTHVFSECQAVNAIENTAPAGFFVTTKGFADLKTTALGKDTKNVSAPYLFLNQDTPFAQIDGPFAVVGGSERSYTLATGSAFKTRNITMITQAPPYPNAPNPNITATVGYRDVWMTGYLDGKCTIDESDLGCTAGVGKVSYLGGHEYDTKVPISKNPTSQGTRLFLNSLFEASCSTDEGQPLINLIKQGPIQTTSNLVTYTLYYANYGPGPALGVVLTDKLPAGATFVSATGGGVHNAGTVTWNIGDLGKAQSGSVQVTVRLASWGTYQNSFSARFMVGLNTRTATSNVVSTNYHKPYPPEPPTPDGGTTPPDAGPLPDGAPTPDQPTLIPSCLVPNALMVLDRSGSMKITTNALCPLGDCSVASSKTCTTAADCAVMPRTLQPLPGTTPRFPTSCKAPSGSTTKVCHYSRWDIAQNTLKELAYQYGGVAPTYAKPKLRMGLLTFNNLASVDAPIVSTPPNITSALNNAAPGGGTSYTNAFLAAHKHLLTTLSSTPGRAPATFILFITDGKPNEGCASSLQIVQSLRTGTGAYRLQTPDGKIHKVKTYVIGFGSSLDADAKACLNQLAVAGGTQRSCTGVPNCSSYYFADNEAVLKQALNGIIVANTAEICDGIDNDCDGKVDEGANGLPLTQACTGSCGAGTQTCVGGKWSLCSGSPSAEICDNKDNNCNNQIDETFPNKGKPCTVGKGVCARTGVYQCNANGSGLVCSVSPGTPSTEICNNKDDDCDGQIDEGLTKACQATCGAGTQTCSAGVWGACVGKVGPKKETCNNLDDDCDKQIDEDFPNKGKPCSVGLGVCKRTGTYVCKPDGTGVQCSVAAGTPSPEKCDNLDNDCNGKIDDGIQCGICKNGATQQCYTGPKGTVGNGPCLAGKQTCVNGNWGSCIGQVLPHPEVCDGKDNDCDGSVDEQISRPCKTACGAGTELCVKGSWAPCTAPKPSKEVCDGKDNDCNGQIDEGCGCKDGAVRPCYTGPANTRNKGICQDGTQTCVGGKWETTCKGEIKPGKPACNGKDDDCDGIVDKGCQAKCKDGETRPCPTRCGSGKQTCKNGAWGTCQGITQATIETCNGKDDDCDGQIDEGMLRACKTVCGPGQDRCVRGRWTGCQGQQPGKEVCDGLDNDCDGKTDEQTSCPSGAQCTDGACPRPCRNGECPKGKYCDKGFCYGTTSCDKVSCPAGSFCRAGICVDTCNVLQCGGGFICWKGQCVPPDCYALGCPKGQVCSQGTCVDNPCAKLQCSSGEYCKAGKCIKPCAAIKCATGESCKEGRCVPDLCAGKTCPQGQICYYGACVADPCKGIQCPNKRVCSLGECVDDPCLMVRCESGMTCQKGECVDLCVGKTCPTGKACVAGECVPDNCYFKGCPDGKICQNAKCVDDPCAKATCSAGAACRAGTCVPSCHKVTCKASERCRDGSCEPNPCFGVSCDVGQICVEGSCKKDLCAAVTCEKGRICDQKTGKCVDDPCLAVRCPDGASCKEGQCINECQNVTCPQGFTCKQGACVAEDCYSTGCDKGKICVQAKCIDDPCLGKKCDANSFCRQGTCVKSCAGVKCKDGQRCTDGACVDDPCANVQCKEGERCDQGTCKPDPCIKVFCPKGRVCDANSGQCVDDPCNYIQCPAGQACYQGQCVGKNDVPNQQTGGEKPLPPSNKEFGYGQDGGFPDGGVAQGTGCGCYSTSSPGLWTFLLLLMMLLPLRRRETR